MPSQMTKRKGQFKRDASGKGYDLTGEVFSRLTILREAEERLNGSKVWVCLCSCGKTAKVRAYALINKHTQSCGCQTINNKKGEDHPKTLKMKQIYGDDWVQSKNNTWYKRAAGIITTAKENGIPIGFKTTYEFAKYLQTITPETCPVFNVPLERGAGKQHKWSPSVDKIVPEMGYVQGNIQIVSQLANAMKQNATHEQLKQFARWVLEKQNA